LDPSWELVKPTLVGLISASARIESSTSLNLFVQKLVRWCRTVVRANGRAYAVAGLKGLALMSRKEALGVDPGRNLKFKCAVPSFSPLTGMERRHRLMQFSRFARALPAPPLSVGLVALKEHKDILTSEFKVPGVLLEMLESHCKDIGERYGSEVPFAFSIPSLSACKEIKREDGGASELVRRLTDEFRGAEIWTADSLRELARSFPEGLFGEFLFYQSTDGSGEQYGTRYPARLDECCFLFRKEYEMTLDGWELCRERLFSVAACWQAVSWDEIPQCRRVLLLEKGWKTRVVTPEEGAFAYLCSIGNSFLLNVLRNHPAVKGSLQGHPADNINWQTGASMRIVRSLDLKSASDYLTHEVNQAVMRGILEGARAPQWMINLSLRAVGPHLVVDPEESWVTTRAALMGNPLTWPILNLVLDWCHSMSGTRGFYAINGDDYLGAHTHSSNALFSYTVGAVGLVVSDGKDFVTDNHSGVFSEELVMVGRRRVYPTCSVRPLCAEQRLLDHPLWGDGPAVCTAVRRLPVSWQPTVERLVATTYRVQFDKLKTAGLDPVAPRWCGGAGFPGVPSLASLRLARGILSQSTKQSLDWTLRLAASWSRAAESMAMGHARELIDSVLSENPSSTTEAGKGRTAEDILASTLGILSPQYLIALGPKGSYERVRLTSVRKRVSRVLEEVRLRAYWVPAASEIRDWSGLDRRLYDLEPRYLLRAPVLYCDLMFRSPPSLWSKVRRRFAQESMTVDSPNLPYKRRRLQLET